jgi:hypothetical protein
MNLMAGDILPINQDLPFEGFENSQQRHHNGPLTAADPPNYSDTFASRESN